MPLFEYKCEVCGKVTEVLEKSGRDSAVIYCKQCNKEQSFTKQYSAFAAPAVKFKDMGTCGEPRGSCGGGGSCGCGGH
jgi:putative FmdB family regulatory protein